MQNQDFSVGNRDDLECALDEFFVLGFFNKIVGERVWVANRFGEEVLALACIKARNDGQFLFAEVINRRVACNCKKPRLKCVRGVVPAEHFPDFDECFLSDIFCRRIGARHTSRKHEDWVEIALYELVKSTLISSSVLENKFIVRMFHSAHSTTLEVYSRLLYGTILMYV